MMCSFPVYNSARRIQHLRETIVDRNEAWSDENDEATATAWLDLAYGGVLVTMMQFKIPRTSRLYGEFAIWR